MRICVVGPVPPIKGGISQHTARLSEGFGRVDGVSAEVLSWAAQYPARLYGRDQIDRAVSPQPGARFELRWWNPFTWLRAAARARTADLLLMPWVVPVHAPIQWLLTVTGRRERPVVFHVHNPTPHEPLPLSVPLARLALRRADLLVTHSESIVDELRALGIRVPTLVVPHPPDLPVRPTDLPYSPPLRLLCFGTVRRYKGFDIAVRALAGLREKGVDATLTVAGEEWEDAQLGTVAEAAGVADLVDLELRYLPDAELIELLASHHIVVAPYRSATQSGVVSLAVAAGRPVVSTTVGGLPELIHDGVEGALVPPDDPTALADGIIAVQQRLEEASADAAASASTWDEMARRIIEAVR